MIGGLASIRAHAPLLTLAYALLWAHALERAGEGLLGLLIAGAHTALVWLWFAASARIESDKGLAARLGLNREPEGAPDEPLAWTSLILAMFFAALSLALLAASWRVGLAFIAAGALLHWHAHTTPSRKYRAIEALAPAFALALPALILAANLPDTTETPVDGARIVGASTLGAIAMGAFILSSLARDALRDASLNIVTSATRAGPQAAALIAWVWMLAVMALAVMGAGWNWWHWSAGAIAGLGASSAGWLLSRNRTGMATAIWYATAVTLSIAVGVSVHEAI